MNSPSKAMPRRTKLRVWFLAVLVAVVALVSACYTVFSAHIHAQQAEDQLITQARAFAEEMDAVWQFFDINQNTINYDSEGNYEFKGLYCSIVGKGIGAIFSSGSDYTIRYTNTTVRNKFDAPDEFEQRALQSFQGQTGQGEYYEMTEYDGEPVFRYAASIRLKESCLDCHGEPKGEIDVTGYPKEGLKEGDLAGTISIIIPAEPYLEDQRQTIVTTVLFFLLLVILIAGALLIAVNRLVTNPLSKLSAATTDMGEGRLGISFDEIHARGEIADLTERFAVMARQLHDAYSNLEQAVADKTEQLQQANVVLEQQREKLAESNELLREANDQLVKDNQYKSDFLATMSHELRTPLTAIMTFIEVLEGSKPLSPKERTALAELRSNTTILLNMINDTLEMAAIQAGRERLLIDDIDLIDVVNHVEASISPLAKRKSIEVTSEVDRDVPIIRGDWERLRHVYENLLSNAVKFTPEGGSIHIGVSLDAERRCVVSSVSDTGIGIAEESLGSIFERFVRVEDATVRGYNGSGLGLAVAKEIVEMHGGTISVTSAVGEGSTFSFTIPVAAEQEGLQ